MRGGISWGDPAENILFRPLIPITRTRAGEKTMFSMCLWKVRVETMDSGVQSSRTEPCLGHQAFEHMQEFYLTPLSLSLLIHKWRYSSKWRAMCSVWHPTNFLYIGGYGYKHHTAGIHLHLQSELMEHPYICRGAHFSGPFLTMRPRPLISVLVLPYKGQDTLTGITDPGQHGDMLGLLIKILEKESPTHSLGVTWVRKCNWN